MVNKWNECSGTCDGDCCMAWCCPCLVLNEITKMAPPGKSFKQNWLVLSLLGLLLGPVFIVVVLMFKEEMGDVFDIEPVQGACYGKHCTIMDFICIWFCDCFWMAGVLKGTAKKITEEREKGGAVQMVGQPVAAQQPPPQMG